MTELATDRALTVADNKQSAKLWIRLVKCHGLVLKAVRRRVGASDTTLPQFDVLAQLLRHPEGMTSTELSRALLVTAGNLTGIVDRLEARELVTRQAQSDDRRVRRLTLTGKGKRLARRARAHHAVAPPCPAQPGGTNSWQACPMSATAALKKGA